MDARTAAMIARLRGQKPPQGPILPGREAEGVRLLNMHFPKATTASPSGVGPGGEVTKDRPSGNVPEDTPGLDYLKDVQLPQDPIAMFQAFLAGLPPKVKDQLRAAADAQGVTFEQLAQEFQKLGIVK